MELGQGKILIVVNKYLVQTMTLDGRCTGSANVHHVLTD